MPIDCFNQKISEHISDNFKYPLEAQEKMIQGRIQVQFTIDEFGNVTNIKTRGPKGAQLLEDEAYRIISLLPKFTPGSL
jgi:TonB family protein